jgi:hypothetical protein
MVDLARATVTIPDVTPDTTSDPGTGNGGRQRGSGGRAGAPKSALEGLRSLAGTRSRGGGGGRRPTRRPGADGSGRIDLRNTWQILAGSILVPLGVVFILMAWYGAAHTAYVQQQIPYLVSGSFAGLGCLILGGLLYWAHWLYRIYDQADLHHEEQLKAFEAALRAIVERQGAPDTDPTGTPAVRAATAASSTSSLSSGAGYDAPPPPPPPPPGRMSTQSYVVTPSGSVYHLPSCPVIAHHTEGLRVLGAAGVADMDACRICLPSGD